MYVKKEHELVIVGNPDTIRGKPSRIICSAGEYQLYNSDGVLVATSTHGKRLGQWAIDDCMCFTVVYDYDLGFDK